jgi:hypothetical protein
MRCCGAPGAAQPRLAGRAPSGFRCAAVHCVLAPSCAAPGAPRPLRLSLRSHRRAGWLVQPRRLADSAPSGFAPLRSTACWRLAAPRQAGRALCGFRCAPSAGWLVLRCGPLRACEPSCAAPGGARCGFRCARLADSAPSGFAPLRSTACWRLAAPRLAGRALCGFRCAPIGARAGWCSRAWRTPRLSIAALHRRRGVGAPECRQKLRDRSPVLIVSSYWYANFRGADL